MQLCWRQSAVQVRFYSHRREVYFGLPRDSHSFVSAKFRVWWRHTFYKSITQYKLHVLLVLGSRELRDYSSRFEHLNVYNNNSNFICINFYMISFYLAN